MRNVAALFVRADSVYKTMPGVDAWDEARDARSWPGGDPVVAHPPCRAWSSLRHMAKPRPDERDLAPWALEQIRRFGGVLEHPRSSLLWRMRGMPTIGGARDAHGGWLLPLHQHWWGHRAEKPTILYIVGVGPLEIPTIPMHLDLVPCKVVSWAGFRKGMPGWRGEVNKKERERTPPAFADWLVELARRTRVAERIAT
jgi:hypothetical protein